MRKCRICKIVIETFNSRRVLGQCLMERQAWRRQRWGENLYFVFNDFVPLPQLFFGEPNRSRRSGRLKSHFHWPIMNWQIPCRTMCTMCSSHYVPWCTTYFFRAAFNQSLCHSPGKHKMLSKLATQSFNILRLIARNPNFLRPKVPYFNVSQRFATFPDQ